MLIRVLEKCDSSSVVSNNDGIDNFNKHPEDYHLPGIQVPRVVKNNDGLIGVKGAVAYLVDGRK